MFLEPVLFIQALINSINIFDKMAVDTRRPISFYLLLFLAIPTTITIFFFNTVVRKGRSLGNIKLFLINSFISIEIEIFNQNYKREKLTISCILICNVIIMNIPNKSLHLYFKVKLLDQI